MRMVEGVERANEVEQADEGCWEQKKEE